MHYFWPIISHLKDRMTKVTLLQMGNPSCVAAISVPRNVSVTMVLPTHGQIFPACRSGGEFVFFSWLLYRAAQHLESYIQLQSIWGVSPACGPLLQLATGQAGQGTPQIDCNLLFFYLSKGINVVIPRSVHLRVWICMNLVRVRLDRARGENTQFLTLKCTPLSNVYPLISGGRLH